MGLRHAVTRVREAVQNHHQLHYRGQYSIERLCALKHYTDAASGFRVLAVGVGTIALAFAIILFLDVIPLQDPNSSWANNVPMWICVVVGSSLLAVSVCFQLQVLAPEARLTLWKSVGVGLFTAAGNCISSILLAATWVFPMPFLHILSMPAWLTSFSSGGAFAVGLDNLKHNTVLRTQLKRYATKLHIESNLLIIYSAYNVVFIGLAGVDQFAFLFVLPVIKYVLKRIVKSVVADLEDLVPAVIITVDLFNALYQSKCMQSSSSLLTTTGIILIDAVQNFNSLRQLFQYMRDVEELTNGEIITQGVLDYTLKLVNGPSQLDADALLQLHINSCVSMSPSKEHSELVHRMSSLKDDVKRTRSHGIPADMPSDQEERPKSPCYSEREKRGSPSFNTIVPWTKEPAVASPEKPRFSTNSTKIVPTIVAVRPPPSRILTNKEKAEVLSKTLQLLWKCERLLLVEYVESAIPLLYAMYLAILYELPNAKYYPGIAEMPPEKLASALASILIYGFLEFFSLLYVHAILRWKFQLLPLRQLAFTLETEALLIQGMFVGWVVIILQFTLVHYGTDFTFHFGWIAKNRNT